jgi:hypothetical protein
VGYAASFFAGQLKAIKSGSGQLRRKALKELHATRGGGETAWLINAFSVFPTSVVGRKGIHKREAVLDGAEPCHALEEFLVWQMR